MRSFLQIITIIILYVTADCAARINMVYKSIGDKAHLMLKEHGNRTIKWRKDHTLIAVVENQKSSTKQREKFHIHVSDKSLFIHNLMVNDSGEYFAQAGQWEEEVIRYKLIVQESVSTPAMETRLEPQPNSSSVCQILVKCSANGDSVTYNCDQNYCSRTNATSTNVNISVVYIDNEMLECTASNRVSTKRTLIPINNSCPKNAKVTTEPNDYILLIVIMSICFSLVLAILLVFLKYIYFNRKKKQTKGRYHEDNGVNTVYSVVHKQQKTPAYSSSAQNTNAEIYDVPSKCVRAADIDGGDSVREDDTHTVYWKLGQTQP